MVTAGGEDLVQQAEACLNSGRLVESMDLARAALRQAGSDRYLAYRAYMLLHQLARRQGQPGKALGFALCARIAALEARLWDLEFRATLEFIELRRELGEGCGAYMAEMMELFAQEGVDIYRYLPDWALRSAGPPQGGGGSPPGGEGAGGSAAPR